MKPSLTPIFLHVRVMLDAVTNKLETLRNISLFIIVGVLAWAAITKYHRLGSLNNKSYFSQFWKLGNPVI